MSAAAKVSSEQLIRSHRKEEIEFLRAQNGAVMSALIQAERDRDRFFGQKQYLAGEHAIERDKRQKSFAALEAIRSLSGNTTLERSSVQEYENAIDEIFQICLGVLEPSEEDEE